MRHHPQRVDARVRATGTMQSWPRGKQSRQRCFDDFLDAGADLLPLPTVVGRAVVSDDELQANP